MEASTHRQVNDLELIQCCASRIISLTTEIERAWEIGVPQGFHNEPWSLNFQRIVVKVYSETMPTAYAKTVAHHFDQCQKLMLNTECPDRADWRLLMEYFGSVSRSIYDQLHISPMAIIEGTNPLSPTTPGLFPYKAIAPLVSREGIARLHQAAVRAQDWCEQVRCQRPSSDDLDIIRRIVAGRTMAGIAFDTNCSERTLYRRLNKIWAGMDVADAHNGILLASKAGWL